MNARDVRVFGRWLVVLGLLALIGCSPEEGAEDRGNNPQSPRRDAGTGDSGSPDAGDAGSKPSCANTDCDVNATCDDTDGTPECRCGVGYEGDGKTCEDIDECAKDNGGCDARATCVNHTGGFVCLCDDGLVGDGETCADPDQCAETELNTCDPNADCTDTADGFDCACGDGLTGDGKGCADVDECDAGDDDCSANAECTNTFGGFSCTCAPGFTGDGADECKSLCDVAAADGGPTCDPNGLCRVNRDRAVCDACAAGYLGTGEVCTAMQNDECPESCDGDGTGEVANAICIGNPGARSCSCAPGYRQDMNPNLPTGVCSEIDECATNNGGCAGTDTSHAANYRCTNLPGGFFCGCAEGFQKNNAGRCVNINECARGSSLCHPNAVCTDTDGSYTCECKDGFEGDGSVCKDVDECEAGEDNCLEENARCVNTNGGFQCRCDRGYAGDGVTECENIDECEDDELNSCAEDATCTDHSPEDNPVGYECECRTGLAGDGRSCGDLDECKNSALNDCAENATCVNTPGSYECKCLPPFTGDDPDNCYCDMSGYWALRQDLDTCWCDRDLLDVTIVSEGKFEASVWELHRYTYDGEVIDVEKGGCGADNGPDLISPFFGETYSSYIPDEVLAEAGLAEGVDVPEPAIVPGSSFITPNEAVVTGMDLGDNPNCTNCFPSNTTQVNEAGGPAPAWIDFEEDGVPGLTLWPRLPSQRTDASNPPPDATYYNYLPVNLDSESNVTHRAGCVSVATRFITRLEADVQTCERIVGEVIQVRAEGRVHSCTLVPPDKWDDDITCDPDDWADAEPCSADDVQRLDEQNQDQTSKARFELVKIGELGDTISCSDVRAALPAISRSTPTPIACDCR